MKLGAVAVLIAFVGATGDRSSPPLFTTLGAGACRDPHGAEPGHCAKRTASLRECGAACAASSSSCHAFQHCTGPLCAGLCCLYTDTPKCPTGGGWKPAPSSEPGLWRSGRCSPAHFTHEWWWTVYMPTERSRQAIAAPRRRGTIVPRWSRFTPTEDGGMCPPAPSRLDPEWIVDNHRTVYGRRVLEMIRTRGLLYVRMPKTASTSIIKMLTAAPRGLVKPVEVNATNVARYSEEADVTVLPIVTSEFFKKLGGDQRRRLQGNRLRFSVVRNPYDKAISGWRYCRTTQRRSLADALRDPPTQAYSYHDCPSTFCRTLFQIERAALHSYGPDAHSC